MASSTPLAPRPPLLTPYFPDDQPWPYDRPARVTVETDDGGCVTRDCQSAKGQPDRPLSEQVLFAKVEALAGSCYPALAREMFGLLDLAPAKLAGRWNDSLERALR